MKLSIVLPIYNVEKYIKKCLDSIYNQGFSDNLFEVIAVNDGTPDKSINIIQNFKSKHDNILIINQENQGVSSARNTGIQNSSGDYIFFVDPDDWIGSQSLKKTYDILSTDKDSDIIIFNSLKSDSLLKCYDWTKFIKENKQFNGLKLFKEKNYFRGSVCGVAFKRAFLNKHNLRFPFGIRNSEDTIFFSICQTLAKSITFQNIDFYYIYNRYGSASNTISLDNIDTYRAALQSCNNIENEYYLNSENASLIEFTKYLVISNLTNVLVNSKISYSSIQKKYNISIYLPIKKEGIPILRRKIQILNSSYKLFYNLTKIKSIVKCLYSKHF